MKDLRKRVIKEILHQDPLRPSSYGVLLSSCLFKKNQMALLVDEENRQCLLLCTNKIGIKDAFLLLTGALSTVVSLESEGLVYVNDEDNHSSIELFYEGKNDFLASQIPGRYIIGDNISLEYTASNKVFLQDSVTLLGTVLPERMFLDIEHVFTSQIYPTKGLEDYVRRGFRSQEQRIAHQSLFAAWVAIFITTIVSVIPTIINLTCG